MVFAHGSSASAIKTNQLRTGKFKAIDYAQRGARPLGIQAPE